MSTRNFDLLALMRELRLGTKVAANLLDVEPKTVQRWLNGEVQVPGPVRQAMSAWKRLQQAGIPWHPAALPLTFMTEDEAQEQARLWNRHLLDLDDVLERVKARGGPVAPWTVDLEEKEAVLGDKMRVYFYAMDNGGFSPSSYTRTDRQPDYERDRPLLEDAIVSIAQETAKSPNWHKVTRRTRRAG